MTDDRFTVDFASRGRSERDDDDGRGGSNQHCGACLPHARGSRSILYSGGLETISSATAGL